MLPGTKGLCFYFSCKNIRSIIRFFQVVSSKINELITVCTFFLLFSYSSIIFQHVHPKHSNDHFHDNPKNNQYLSIEVVASQNHYLHVFCTTWSFVCFPSTHIFTRVVTNGKVLRSLFYTNLYTHHSFFYNKAFYFPNNII